MDQIPSKHLNMPELNENGMRSSPAFLIASWPSRLRSILPPAIAISLLIIIWELWTSIGNVPIYIFPGPRVVVSGLSEDYAFFIKHGTITLLEAIAGFLLGFLIAFSAATLMVHWRLVEKVLYPLAVLVKVTPIVSVAPLFVIWFGFGSGPKVLIAAIITFFPILINSIAGLRSVNPGALDFLRSVDATQKEIFIKLRVPSSLPYLFAAFRITIPLSIIGAVVGEWFTGDSGLGSVIIVAHNNLDMPTLFAAVLVLALMGVALTALTSYVEKRVLFWHESFIVP